MGWWAWLDTTLGQQGCQLVKELGLEQHRARTGWNSVAPLCWLLTACNHGSRECCLLSLPGIMLISSVANSAL